MHASGLSVTDDAIQFVRFAHNNKAALESYGEVIVPDAVMDGGDVVKPDEFVDLLKQIKDQYKLSLVDVSIPEEKSYLFKTVVLGENLKEITSNIEMKIQENVPFKVSEIVFDFALLDADSHKNEREVVVSVLPRTVVNNYLKAFHKAGLIPVSFQVESQAVTEAAVPKDNKQSVLVTHIKDDKASFYIVTGRTVQFSSTVDIQGGGVTMLLDDSDNTKEYSEEKQDELNGFDMKILVREIKKILTYWKSHEGQKEDAAIQAIYLTGTIAEEIKLTDYISNSISLPVEVSNVWQNAFSFDATIPNMERSDSLRYAAAIGLALPKGS